MGTSGAIATIHPNDFKLDMVHFRKSLRYRWPDVQIKDVFEGNIDFGMTLTGEFVSFAGSTVKQQQISWWSGLDEFAEFIVWYRDYVPKEHKLLAWDKGVYNHMVVHPKVREGEIVSSLSGNRHSCELYPIPESIEFQQNIIKQLSETWEDYLICESATDLVWFLKTQEAHTEPDPVTDRPILKFSDNSTEFIAEFSVWERQLTNIDQTLTVIVDPYPRSKEIVKIELTEQVTRNEVAERLDHALIK